MENIMETDLQDYDHSYGINFEWPLVLLFWSEILNCVSIYFFNLTCFVLRHHKMYLERETELKFVRY